MLRRISLAVGLTLLGIVPVRAVELDYQAYWAHLSDVQCPHFTYDCGGYRDLEVDATRAYAVAEGHGLQVIDISDPIAVVNRGFLPYGGGTNCVTLLDHYAFLGKQPPNSVLIADLDDADAPALVGSFALPSAPSDLIVVGGALYVATSDGSLRIYDADDPAQPVFLLSVTLPLGAARELALDGNRLYAAGDGGLVVYLVASPESPLLLGSFALGGGTVNALAVQGSLALVAQGPQTRIIDVSEASDMHVDGVIAGWAFGLLLAGEEAWIGSQDCWSYSGLDIYDLVDPAQPVLLYQDGWGLRGGPAAMVEREGLVYAAEWMCWCAGEWPGFHVYRRGDLPAPAPLAQLNVGSGRSLLARYDLLYVGTSGSILAYDLATPAAPEALGSFGAGRTAICMLAAGDRLLAIDEVASGQPRRLQLYDFGTGWEPAARGWVTVGANSLAMAATGDAVLVAGGGGGGLVVVDAANPDAPAIVGTQFPGETVYAVAADGAFAAVAVGAEVRLLDVSLPSAPLPLGVIPADPGYVRDELQLLTLDGRRYLLCAHNDNTSWYEYTDSAEIWDVTDAAQPARVLVVPLLAADYCRSFAWRDGVLYIQGSSNLTAYAWSGTAHPSAFLGRVGDDAYPWGNNAVALTGHAVAGTTSAGNVLLWSPQRNASSAVWPPPAASAGPALAVSPNPFAPRVHLRFSLPAAGRAELTVHDLAGRLVRRLEAGDLPAGVHARIWNGHDGQGRPVASGTYVARLATVAGVETRKLVLVR
jgi:hypothetical protein